MARRKKRLTWEEVGKFFVYGIAFFILASIFAPAQVQRQSTNIQAYAENANFTDFAASTNNVTALTSDTPASPPIKDVARSPSRYANQTITVTGGVHLSTNSAASNRVTTGTGYELLLKNCDSFEIEIRRGNTYRLTGRIEQRTYQGIGDDLTMTEKTDYFLVCTQPPEYVSG
ncbi:MAG: hypothetical protein ABEI52_07700 [Halobacteriaceae archaeon]